jgi:enoyl-CoA hydratase
MSGRDTPFSLFTHPSGNRGETSLRKSAPTSGNRNYHGAMPISCTVDAGIALLRLELGRGNAIDPAFLDALHAALDEARRADARAVVLTGKGRVFCGGLDLVTLYAFDRPAMERFLVAFDDLFLRLYAFERPTVAAVNGHALAGGCILAMACDRRIMADGAFQIGVNEVQLGIPFPASAYEIVRKATPSRSRSAVLLQGARFSPAEALAAGLVHRLAGERGAVDDALDEARAFATAGPAAVRAVKDDLTAPVAAKIAATAEAKRARFLDHWFSAEARARIGALHEALVSKQKPAG